MPPGALPPGAAIALTAPDAAELAMFAELPVLRATPAVALQGTALVRVPYTDEFLRRYHVADARTLVLYARTDDGLWEILPSAVLPEERAVVAGVARLTTWAVAPAGLLGAWQARGIIGQRFAAGERNVLVVHGWNSSPWDGCMYELIGALSEDYGRVAAYVYPSALDIGANGAWLRDAMAREADGATFDVVAFSEGGLVARAAIEPGAWNGGRTMAGVRALITIATPHSGLLPAVLPSVLGDVAGAEMQAGSAFLRALDAAPAHGGARYYAIAGDGAPDRASDGLVGVASALGLGVFAADGTAVVPLTHARGFGEGAAMPCDGRVYGQVAAWGR